MLNRFASIQDDGTVKFDVPGDIRDQPLDFGTGVIYDGDGDGVADSEDAVLLPPLQIAMLIVGTRGDVQPFVAIGKRLQVEGKICLVILVCVLQCSCIGDEVYPNSHMF